MRILRRAMLKAYTPSAIKPGDQRERVTLDAVGRCGGRWARKVDAVFKLVRLAGGPGDGGAGKT